VNESVDSGSWSSPRPDLTCIGTVVGRIESERSRRGLCSDHNCPANTMIVAIIKATNVLFIESPVNPSCNVA